MECSSSLKEQIENFAIHHVTVKTISTIQREEIPVLSKPKTTEPKRAYTTADIAKESGVKSPAIVRRILRAAAIKKPKDGWSWPDKAAAKDALAAVRKAQRPETKKLA